MTNAQLIRRIEALIRAAKRNLAIIEKCEARMVKP